MPRHCESAQAVADHLARHPPSSGSTIRARRQPLCGARERYLPRGGGGILTFGIKGGAATGRALHRVRAVSFASRERRRCEDAGHPSGIDHAPQLSEDEQRAAGVSPEMIRLSIGLESIDDILWDIDQALEKAIR
jgi:O-acetylhomoserine (thiol)-lyase